MDLAFIVMILQMESNSVTLVARRLVIVILVLEDLCLTRSEQSVFQD